MVGPDDIATLSFVSSRRLLSDDTTTFTQNGTIHAYDGENMLSRSLISADMEGRKASSRPIVPVIVGWRAGFAWPAYRNTKLTTKTAPPIPQQPCPRTAPVVGFLQGTGVCPIVVVCRSHTSREGMESRARAPCMYRGRQVCDDDARVSPILRFDYARGMVVSRIARPSISKWR